MKKISITIKESLKLLAIREKNGKITLFGVITEYHILRNGFKLEKNRDILKLLI